MTVLNKSSILDDHYSIRFNKSINIASHCENCLCLEPLLKDRLDKLGTIVISAGVLLLIEDNILPAIDGSGKEDELFLANCEHIVLDLGVDTISK